MKIKLLSILMLAFSSQAFSGSDYYRDYFNVNTVTNVNEQIRLYNQENGYWEHDEILNQELKRHLIELELIGQHDEENGYWI